MLFPYRNHPLETLAQHLPLEVDVLTWTPPGGMNSIGWLLRHIYESEDYWVHQLAYGSAVARADVADDPTALIAEYRRVREATDARIAAMTEAELTRVVEVPTFNDGWAPPVAPTVHWVLHHVFEHEMYHIGQIAMLLRLQGRRPLPF